MLVLVMGTLAMANIFLTGYLLAATPPQPECFEIRKEIQMGR